MQIVPCCSEHVVAHRATYILAEVFVRPSLYEGSAAFTRQSSSDRFLNPRNTYRIDHASQREEDES